jgi:hypothetical protein
MKPCAFLCLLAGLAPALCAGPVETSIMAVMRLADEPSYSWTSTVSDDARTYDIVGQTTRGGFTRVKMPVVNAVRLRLGRSVTDTQIEAIFRGNVRCVFLTEQRWKTIDELPAPDEDDEFENIAAASNTAGSIIGLGAPTNTVPGMGAATRRRNRDDLKPPAYSNLQLAICHPHEELGVIVSSHTDWNIEGDVITGTLTELGAQLLLVHDGQTEIEPQRASGTFTVWLRGGRVAKYQVNAEGILTVAAKHRRHQVAVRQTSTTVLRDIGTTRFEVPDEARLKLAPR